MKQWIKKIIGAVSLFICIALIGGIMYTAIVMGQPPELEEQVREVAAPLEYLEPMAIDSALSFETVADYFPHPMAQMPQPYASSGAKAYDQQVGRETCRVVTYAYTQDDGSTFELTSATPASYMTHFANSSYSTEAKIGYVLGHYDAAYMTGEQHGYLIARDGEAVYVLSGPKDDNALYAIAAQVIFE